MSDKPYGSGDTAWFVQDRFGMFIHWGLYAQAARHEWVKNKEKITREDYQKYFDSFNPDLYNPKEWARLAKGGTVLLLPKKGSIKRTVAMAFQTGFWSPMFSKAAASQPLSLCRWRGICSCS